MLATMFDLGGTAVFAVTGALAAGRRQLDMFGVTVIAIVTAVGGGTVRDLILGARPVFWVAAQHYLWTAIVAALLTFSVGRRWPLSERLFGVLDAVGLAAFTVLGAQRALDLGAAPPVAVVMAVIGGVSGGILRDVLCNEVPIILTGELYATTVLAGGIVYVAVVVGGGAAATAALTGAAVTLALRLLAMRYGWRLPTFATASH